MPAAVSLSPAMLVPARSFSRSWPPPATHLLVALGLAVWAWSYVWFLLAETLPLRGGGIPLSAWLTGLQGLENSTLLRTYAAWSAEGLLHGRLWQPFGHLFVHQGLIHAALNLGLLLLAGRAVEPILGRRLLVALFLAAGVTGGAVELAFARPGACVFGSSAAVYGVIAAACVVWSDFDLRALRVLRWLPVPFKPRHLLPCIVLVQFTAFLLENTPAVTDRLLRAHQLGCLTGCFIGWMLARRLGFGRRETMLRPPPAPPPAIEMETELAEDPQEYIRDEIDPILDKIQARGMDSLTPGERRRLARASRMLSR